MKKAYNQYITEDFLKRRENVDKPIQKWILFCRYFMSKGYKIRLYEARKTVSKYITLIKDGKIYNSKNGITSICVDSLGMESSWELYQEPINWDYIIKNKCLCWFWDDAEDKPVICDVLIEMVSGRFSGFRSENGSCWKHCRPVRRDEVTFYEDRTNED